MEDEFVVWTAGFFDGEGSVFAVRRNFSFGVGIGNTDYNALALIHRYFGGGLNSNIYSPRVYYVLAWGMKAGKRFIQQIRPYLRVKCQVVDLVLAWPVSFSGVNLTKEQRERRRQLYLELNRLNGKSVRLT